MQGFEAIEVRPASTPGSQRFPYPFTEEKLPKSAGTSSGYGRAPQAATETSKARAARGAQSSHANTQEAFELPRVQDVWGQSICRKLLERAPRGRRYLLTVSFEFKTVYHLSCSGGI